MSLKSLLMYSDQRNFKTIALSTIATKGATVAPAKNPIRDSKGKLYERGYLNSVVISLFIINN